MTIHVNELKVSDFNCEPNERFEFGDNLRPMLSYLLGLGRASGATFVEFFIEGYKNLAVMSQNGETHGITPTVGGGVGVRVFVGLKDSYSYTSNFTFAGLKDILQKALSLHGLNLYTGKLVADVELGILSDYTTKKAGYLRSLPVISSVAEVLNSLSHRAKENIKYANTVVSRANRVYQEVLVAASDGTYAKDIRLNQFMAFSVIAENGADRHNAYLTVSSTDDPSSILKLNHMALIEQLNESVQTMLPAKFVESGSYPVILANGFGGVIFHEACGHLLETTQIVRGSSPFAKLKGQKIAHECVTAFDEGVSPNAYGSIAMDDEGMPSQRTVLIENGVLVNFLADRLGSLKTGHPRTGSGRRQNHRLAAASRMRNSYFATGNSSLEEMLSTIDKGVYCKQMGGGSVGAAGEFNFAVNEAFLIENGKITNPVKGATLIGRSVDILPNISMVGSDLTVAPGHCGSISGSIPTTCGQPHIKVDKITVGGV